MKEEILSSDPLVVCTRYEAGRRWEEAQFRFVPTHAGDSTRRLLYQADENPSAREDIDVLETVNIGFPPTEAGVDEAIALLRRHTEYYPIHLIRMGTVDIRPEDPNRSPISISDAEAEAIRRTLIRRFPQFFGLGI